MKFKKDKRDKFWKWLEANIQEVARNKDKRFILSGKWKKFLRQERGFKIFAVNGDWTRNNLSVIFDHGGHGFVHEFIPLNEIWVGLRHPRKCSCRRVRKDRKMSKDYFNSTVLHEITEFKEMKKGLIYWKAHQIALRAEIKAGILKDPYSEV